MYLYINGYKLCQCGLETNLLDYFGNSLKTGDLVCVLGTNSLTQEINYYSESLSPVAVCQFRENGKILNKDEIKENAYIMGIKGVYPSDGWRAVLVKKHKEIIDGKILTNGWCGIEFKYKNF